MECPEASTQEMNENEMADGSSYQGYFNPMGNEKPRTARLRLQEPGFRRKRHSMVCIPHPMTACSFSRRFRAAAAMLLETCQGALTDG
jgi:hypothetical protein